MTLKAPKATTWSVEDIVTHAKEGELLLPVFQRNFRWQRKDVVKFFDSLYRGYPVGNLLVWKTKPREGARASFGPLAFERTDESAFLIIDGQQRITSLVATLLGGGAEDGRFNVYFDLDAGEFKQPTPSSEPTDSWLPMTKVSDTVEYLQWLQQRQLTNDQIGKANEVVRAFREYRIPVYTVIGGSEQEGLIREIFSRLNTTGKPLKEAEIFNAIHQGAGPSGLANVSEAIGKLNFGTLDQTWLLKALAATLDLDQPKRLGASFAKMAQHERDNALAALEESLKSTASFLRVEARVANWNLLPYRFPIIPLSAFFAHYPDAGNIAKGNLRRWLWLGAVSGRHAAITRPIIRASLDAVSESSTAEDAASRLLKVLHGVSGRFDLRPHNYRNAATKIVCAVMANLGPVHLGTEERISLAEVLEAEQPFPQLVVRARAGTETRILHPMLARGAKTNSRAMSKLLCGTSSIAILRSHGIDEEALSCLRRGDENGFLSARRSYLGSVVNEFIKTMTD